MDILCQVVSALHHCHHPNGAKGVVLHRDIEPENSKWNLWLTVDVANALLKDLLLPLLLGSKSMSKLADFGLGKSVAIEDPTATSFVGYVAR